MSTKRPGKPNPESSSAGASSPKAAIESREVGVLVAGVLEVGVLESLVAGVLEPFVARVLARGGTVAAAC